MLTDSKRERVAEWNAPRRAVPLAQWVPELVSARAAERPEAVALAATERVLTYHELDTRANRLAHALRALGVGPDAVVGLCARSSPEMVVGALAILKAGGAYLPLDPAYPSERLAFMLDDARVPVILTQQRLADGLPASAARLVLLDGDWPAISRASEQNLTPAAGRDHL